MLLVFSRNCWQPSRTVQYVALITVVLFIMFGAVVFQTLEEQPQRDRIAEEKRIFRRCIVNALRRSLPSIADTYGSPMIRHLSTACFNDTAPRWTWSNSILFSFSVVTTIGYGHIVPETTSGRIFCSIYAIIGIPLTMIAIANIGKYISDMIQWLERRMRKRYREYKERKIIKSTDRALNRLEEERNDAEDKEKSRLTGDRLVIAFVLYVAIGSALMTTWENQMSYWIAVYFNVFSLTTIGFGDYWPRNTYFMPLTLIYLALGLAIASIALSVASDYLRKLHYYRQKIENVRQVVVKFGGSKMSVGRLLNIVTKQLGVDPETLEDLNLDVIVEHETKNPYSDIPMDYDSAYKPQMGLYRQMHYIDLESPIMATETSFTHLIGSS
uniref:Potassium channel domain-containing protein n=1 Tax=Plectus sambesii TaxID=2011161 RepID=A0A914XUR9_9BILA